MADEIVRDNPNVVEVYANRIIECSTDGSSISLVFGKVRLNIDRTGSVKQIKDPEAVINSRLCLSEQCALELHQVLGGALNALAKTRGKTPAPEPRTNPN